MIRNRYEYIKNSNIESSKKMICPYPFSVPEWNNPIWEQISEKLKQFVELKNINNSDNLTVDFEEDIYNLISGSVNLINYIINLPKPVSEIFFLDKSARLGQYIFRILWTELKEKGKISSEHTLPKIRFINIGKHEDHKHKSERAMSLITDLLLRKNINHSNILVVDEVLVSGMSLKKALKFFEKSMKIKASGITNFTYLPKWYGLDQVKGVEDVHVESSIYSIIENLSQEEFEIIKSIAYSGLEEKLLIDIFNSAGSLPLNLFINKFNGNNGVQIDQNVLEKFHQIMFCQPFPTEMVFRYFKSLGGFIAKKPGKDYHKESMRYREYLKELIKISSEYIVIKKPNYIERIKKIILRYIRGF